MKPQVKPKQNTLSSWLSFIEGIQSQAVIQLGLERISHVAKVMGLLPFPLPVVTVAGTNGKGSVSMKVARSLESMGIKTGLFTSPHIISFRERVQVNS